MSLEDIRARKQKADDELDRLTAGNPGTAWRWSIPANPERDSDLVLAASIADIPKLLAALDAVLALHADARGRCAECDTADTLVLHPCPTVEVITEALR